MGRRSGNPYKLCGGFGVMWAIRICVCRVCVKLLFLV